MKICFVADAGSSHTKKWCRWFINKGHMVSVISLTNGQIEGADIKVINTGANARGKEFSKFKYFKSVHIIKSYIEELEPDIISVHYASSYGTIMALSGIKNYILSVWGSDIFDFPKKSLLHKMIIKYSLKKAKYIFSTSNVMADETSKYTNKKIYVTPFGVDMKLFNPSRREERYTDLFVIGNIKSLTEVYGIEYILRAGSIIAENNKEIDFQIRIAGKGELEQYYKELALKLGLKDKVVWLGYISEQEAAKEWANMDVAVIPSIRESFGVSAIEAEASGTPVIISDAEGLIEVTCPGESSFVTRKCDAEDIAQRIVELYKNRKLLKKMGVSGRLFVEQKYEIDRCFNYIESLFKEIKDKESENYV